MANEIKKEPEAQKTFGDALTEKGYASYYEVAEFEDLGKTPNGEFVALGLKNSVGNKLPAIVVRADKLALLAEALQRKYGK